MILQEWKPTVIIIAVSFFGLFFLGILYWFIKKKRLQNLTSQIDETQISTLPSSTKQDQPEDRKERQKLQDKLWRALEDISKLIRSRQFSQAQNKLEDINKIALQNQFFGILTEIKLKLNICNRNLQLQARQDELWEKFEDGNIAESYIELFELSETTQAEGKKQWIHPYISSQLLAKVKRIGEEFKKDKDHTRQLIERFSEMILEEKFYVTQNRLNITKEICINLKFREFIPEIELLLKKSKININFLEEYNKNKEVYHAGKLRLSYNGMDILERKSKFAKFKPLLVESLALKVFILFQQIRQELKVHKTALEQTLKEVYRMINRQEFEKAKITLAEATIEARQYDFYGIIRDIEYQLREIKKFESQIKDR
ncbi:hypothetical protein NEF87_002935 [Candidatus Lokiarchaeum ossiferum]|uniref:Uncharacterized protein n=1 Tax=Candidatus Lokiarchaeum ossiferum TaxID=2951803 RepID=A0ABY6HT06_9ARCH|nr:hypothetical protein NEF87_002935 [Candidatus Lokiarchaeum sp. B-35]